MVPGFLFSLASRTGETVVAIKLSLILQVFRWHPRTLPKMWGELYERIVAAVLKPELLSPAWRTKIDERAASC
jgi:hypothetical protein